MEKREDNIQLINEMFEEHKYLIDKLYDKYSFIGINKNELNELLIDSSVETTKIDRANTRKMIEGYKAKSKKKTV